MTSRIEPNSISFSSLFDESFHITAMMVDRDFRIIRSSPSALEMIGNGLTSAPAGLTCHQLFYNNDVSCRDCPLAGCIKPFNGFKSLTIQDGSKKRFIKNQILSWENFSLFIFQDMTREIDLIRTMELSRKKLTAQIVLLKQKNKKIADRHHLLKDLMDHLPDAVIEVDENFNIRYKNSTVKQITSETNAEKCFQMFGHAGPCDVCPAKFGFISGSGCKKSHCINDRYYTETISPAPDGTGGLLLFRNTTRQVMLIEQIRQQQETIKHKNKILSGLVHFGAFMQNESELESVVDFFLEQLLSVVSFNSAVVIVNDIRKGNLWITAQRGVDDSLMKTLARAYLSRDIQTSKTNKIPMGVLPWSETTQIQLSGGNGSKVGLIVLRGHFDDKNELIRLYSEPFGAHIHNRLLMRRLEEKANTDAMTGLFNRGFVEQALLEEQLKFENYNIHYSVVVVDVNRLKMANDVYGHEIGDRLLQTVSDLLLQTVRATDIVARTGGDEFLILLTNTPNDRADLFVNRLVNNVFNDVTLKVGANEKFPVTVSAGAAGTDRYPPEKLIKEADRLMYAHKEAYYKTHKRYR